MSKRTLLTKQQQLILRQNCQIVQFWQNRFWKQKGRFCQTFDNYVCFDKKSCLTLAVLTTAQKSDIVKRPPVKRRILSKRDCFFEGKNLFSLSKRNFIPICRKSLVWQQNIVPFGVIFRFDKAFWHMRLFYKLLEIQGIRR